MDQEHIDYLLQNFVNSYKVYMQKKRGNKEVRVPYRKNYDVEVEMMERIKVHAETGIFPDGLFAKRSPNQSEEEFSYIKDNYKQVTEPVYQDFLNQINRVFQDTNYNIQYAEDAQQFSDQPYQEYVANEMYKYGSLEAFVKYYLPNLKLIDPNGVIVVRPHDVHFEMDEDGNKVAVYGGNDDLVEPIPYYYSSKQIVAIKEDEYVMVLTDEKTKVEYAGSERMEGAVLELYTRNEIYRIEQYGKAVDYTFRGILMFEHELDVEPYKKLMGIPRLHNGDVVYKSPFMSAVDLLDLVLLNSANLQVSINMCVYPYRVMIGEECDFVDGEENICDAGTVHTPDGKYKCPKCDGSGLRSRVSPMGVLLLRPPKRDQEGEGNLTQAPIQYVSPQTDALQFLKEKIADDEYKARRILHLTTSSSDVKGSADMTATNMALDLKALYAFLKPISDQIFDIWRYMAMVIGKMRYGDDFQPPEFTYPKNFDFLTEQDYMDQVKEMMEAGMPSALINAVLSKYINRLFYNEPRVNEIFKLAMEADRLFTMSDDAISIKANTGSIEPWEDVLHTSILYIIRDLMEEDDEFLQKEFEEQKEALIERAKELTPSVTPTTPPIIE